MGGIKREISHRSLTCTIATASAVRPSGGCSASKSSLSLRGGRGVVERVREEVVDRRMGRGEVG